MRQLDIRPAFARWVPRKYLGLGVVVMLAVSACQSVAGPAVLSAPPVAQNASAAVSTDSTRAASTQAFTARLQFAPPRGKVGDSIQVEGSGYAPGAQVDLVWYTVNGHYEMAGGTEFVGERFEETSRVVATARADQAGDLAASFQVPVDFGGAHDVRGRVNGEEVSQASVTIDPTVSLSPTEGPVGTPIELRIVGVDSRTSINTWQILYDNKYLGFATAVTTPGVAVARFRATGPVGNHQVGAYNNSYHRTPYLAWDTSPFKDIPGPGTDLVFKTTSDPGLLAPVLDDFSAGDNPVAADTQGPGSLSLSVDRGVVGRPTTLRGSNLPANADLSLRWWTTVGDRVSGGGYTDKPTPLAQVRTDASGSFVQDLAIPDDLGGHHRIDVVAGGDQVLGSTGIVIEPSLVDISPTRLQSGDKVEIHLKGVGWTTYDNTYAVTYDNAYIGYVCGFSTNGDVRWSMVATGAPGTHIIDLYPTIYKPKDYNVMPQGIYSIPQLTYADDHPRRTTPAIRLSIEIAE